MAEPSVLPDRLPAPNASVEVATFPGALVAFDVRNRTAHELVGAPAVVLDACRERLGTDAVVAELAMAGLGGSGDARALVAAVLADLADLGLLEGCAAPSPPPCIECGERRPGRFRRRGR